MNRNETGIVGYGSEGTTGWSEPQPPPVPSAMPNVNTLQLRYYPDDILHKKCGPVVYTPEVKALAVRMLTTMIDRKGFGIAAPQVGHSMRVFLVDVEWPEIGPETSKTYCFINPALISKSKETVKSVEGCLSFPGEQLEVIRHKKVVITALDFEGEPFTLEAEGLLAVVMQHEYDHIEGKTFADRVSYLKRSIIRKSMLKKLKQAGLR